MSEQLTQPRSDPPDPPPGARPGATHQVDDGLSAMTKRFNLFFLWFARRFFRHFDLDDATVAQLRTLEDRGSVIYVMRYSSRLDYFLFNALFRREGLRLSGFANGIRFYYYRPLFEALGIALSRRRGTPDALAHTAARAQARAHAEGGESMFLFLRTATLRSFLRGRRGAVEEGARELDLLEEVVSTVWDTGNPVSLVPLALFWRKGPRARRRFLNLFYGAQTRPSDLAKVASFLTTYRGLFVKVGDPIDLNQFIESRRDQGPHAVARTVRRSILMFLYREEKVVEGPTLLPIHRVQDVVVEDPSVQRAIRARAEERHIPIERARSDAGRMFREIAANMNSMFLAVLNVIVGAIMRRLFAKIEVSGIEKVAEHAKHQPVILVPSHRSYFDFVIVSSMFYDHHLVPPHIAARENMAFGPFGFIFRRAGAFFLRKSFDDPLYKEVFRSYVAHLIREGFTQEFFIEGGRSRTGKTLAPRLGMLSWNVEAFLASARRDLFFVPMAITYERLVEEGVMVGELQGEAKETESVMGLVRARKYLQRRFGSVHVNFGEPFSLGDALGDRRTDFAKAETDELKAEKRAFVEMLGNRIAEAINWSAVLNATSLVSCAFLGERRRGLFRGDLVNRMQEVVDLLRIQGVALTPALARDEGEYRDSIASMLEAGLIRSNKDPRGEILYFEESKRRAHDLYRNSIAQYLAIPSFLARRLLQSPPFDSLETELVRSLDFFYYEFFTPRGATFQANFRAILDHFERMGWVERHETRLRPTEKGTPCLHFLSEQTRGVVEVYYATTGALLGNEGDITSTGLQKLAAEQFERSRLLGEVERSEASNPVTFGNAVDLLVRIQVLERAPDPEEGAPPRDSEYVPGASWDDLSRLHERLAMALTAG
ncbi:MAG: 1-acyl-sn-glycerol-3-phosphate acyltransferase [Myxococcales bacterium]|nr:1-acyl-sn-glycerol-3-phosphate acyltransferase [Myxococcales bacterium]